MSERDGEIRSSDFDFRSSPSGRRLYYYLLCAVDFATNSATEALNILRVGHRVTQNGVFYSDCINKYCTPNLCAKNLQHTLCKFQPGPASHCLAYELLIKSDKDKQLVLDKINARRDKVAAGEIKSLPSAEDMFKMEWNEELAESAQRWADQCVTNKGVGDVEDDCRDLENMQVGQIVATVYGEAPGLTPPALVDVWYLQLLNVNASVLAQYIPSNELGPSSYNQFTQLVWGASYQVGCGGVKFKDYLEDLEEKNERVVYRLVCNFAPQGNQLGQSVYTAGRAGAKCLYGISNIYKTLCNSQTMQLHENDTKDSDDVESEEENTTDNINDDGTPMINNETIDTTPPSTVLDVYGDDNMTFDYFSHLFELNKQHFPTATTTEKPKCKNDLAVDEIVEIVKNKLSDDPALKAVFATTAPISTGSIIKDEKVAAFLNKIYKKATSPLKPITTSTDFVNSTLLVNLVEAVMFRNRDELKDKITEELVTGPFVNPIKVQAVSAFKSSYDFTGHYFFPEYDGEETAQQTSETDYDTAAKTSLPDVVLEIEEIRKSRPTRDFIDDILETEPVIETTTRMKLLSPDDIKLPTSGYNNMRNFLKDIAENAENSDGMFTSMRKDTNRFTRKKRRNKNIKNYDIFELDDHLCMITRFDDRPVREHFKSPTSLRVKHCVTISDLEYDIDARNYFLNKCVPLVPIGSISVLAVINCFSYQKYL